MSVSHICTCDFWVSFRGVLSDRGWAFTPTVEKHRVQQVSWRLSLQGHERGSLRSLWWFSVTSRQGERCYYSQGNWWVMTRNLNPLGFLAREPLLSEKGVWNLKQKHVDFLVLASLLLIPRPCFHCPLCMSVSILPGSWSSISGCTEGNLAGPGQGKTMLRACPVKAANPSLKPENALKMRCWQALLKKYRI